jgi:hypothetical protein
MSRPRLQRFAALSLAVQRSGALPLRAGAAAIAASGGWPSVVAGGQRPVEDVEAMCDGLAAQRYFLDDAGWTVWLDGTRSRSYHFQHALYRQVLYEGLGTIWWR